jgi:isopropylmalate/homocitrate/citramalate synthase
MSSTLSQNNTPWYSDGRFWVSPHNYAPEVRSQFNFSPQFRILDSTIRKILMSPSERITVNEALHVAEKLREAGVRYINLNLLWYGSKEPEALAYQIIKAIFERFDFEISLHVDGLHQTGWEGKVDTALALGATEIGLLLPTSDFALRAPNAPSKNAVLEHLEAVTKYIQKAGVQASVSAHDSARTEFSWLVTYLRRATELGHVRLDLADSSGTLSPEAVKYFIRTIREQLKSDIPVSLHIHQDLGLADAGALAAATVGAWPDTSVNGVSYRAGFASLQNVVAALDILYGVRTGIDMTKFAALSKLVASHTFPVQAHQAFTGDHAFVKESPGGVAAAIAAGDHYFPPVDCALAPEIFGAKTHIVWGRQTLAGTALQVKLQSLGLEATPDNVERVRQALIQKRSELHDYPRWLEDDEVSQVARELLTPSLAGRP